MHLDGDCKYEIMAVNTNSSCVKKFNEGIGIFREAGHFSFFCV